MKKKKVTVVLSLGAAALLLIDSRIWNAYRRDHREWKCDDWKHFTGYG